MRGKLISISGVDGAGKSTQIDRLLAGLGAAGYRCVSARFAATDYGEHAGASLRELRAQQPDVVFTRLGLDWADRYPLVRDFVGHESLQRPALALAVTAVSAAGSLQVYDQCLRPLLESGVHIVCDRYWLDDLVYRSFWVDEALIRSLHAGIPLPDLALFLDVPETVLRDRNKGRQDGDTPLLRRPSGIHEIRQRFIEVAQSHGMKTVDGNRSAEQVAESLRSAVEGSIGGRP